MTRVLWCDKRFLDDDWDDVIVRGQNELIQIIELVVYCFDKVELISWRYIGINHGIYTRNIAVQDKQFLRREDFLCLKRV